MPAAFFYIAKQAFFYIVENMIKGKYKQGDNHCVSSYCIHAYERLEKKGSNCMKGNELLSKL